MFQAFHEAPRIVGSFTVLKELNADRENILTCTKLVPAPVKRIGRPVMETSGEHPMETVAL